MKLYYAPGACSLAPHIVLREAGFDFDLEKVDLGTKRTARGEDYAEINPKGYVPALKLDSGQILTEVAVILQYLADRKPEAGLAPESGSMERYRLMEWLNFIASEVHKTLGALFNPKVGGDWKENLLSQLRRRLDYLSRQLADEPYLMGTRFSLADAYLFTVLGWSGVLHVSLEPWPKLKEYLDRVAIRPAVSAAMKAEGLAG